ncbi:toxin PezT, partial [Streptococcus pneumoniae]
DSGEDTTSAATVLHDLLFGEWNTVEKEMLKIGQERLWVINKELNNRGD